MKDLGELHHFLGMEVQRIGDDLFLSQHQYMIDILNRAGMADCKPVSTPVDCNPKLSADGVPVQDATDFRSLAGALQNLTFTRPDIAYAVQQICLYMHGSRISLLSSGFSGTSVARCIWVWSFGLLPQPNWWSTPTQTGRDVPKRASPPRASLCFLGTIWSHGPPSGRIQSPDPAPKPSIAPLPMQLPRCPGCDSFFMSSTLPFVVQF